MQCIKSKEGILSMCRIICHNTYLLLLNLFLVVRVIKARARRNFKKSVHATRVIDEISSSIFNKVNKALFFLELHGPL
jgi:hypothetical protein